MRMRDNKFNFEPHTHHCSLLFEMRFIVISAMVSYGQQLYFGDLLNSEYNLARRFYYPPNFFNFSFLILPLYYTIKIF